MRGIKRRFSVLFILAMTAVVLAACSNPVKEKTTEKRVESNKTENSNKKDVKVISDGEPVKDDKIFGENTKIYSPKDDQAKIQSEITSIYKQQERNQFGDERYAILFKPGKYVDTLNVNVGYYTQVAGLGIVPTETEINRLWVDANWMFHNATCNFWRSAENFNVTQYCMWANSQAVSLRRMNFDSGIVLSDGEGWSSGGFLSDSKFGGKVSSGSQQQYFFRNNEWQYFDNGVWNMVFDGVDRNTITPGEWPMMPYTKIDKTEYVQEKPFLVYDEKDGYGVFVPKARDKSVGTTWAKDGASGTFYSLNKFFVAKPSNTVQEINEALASGKSLVLTPGIYEYDEPIKVTKKDTIVYGMGLATIVAKSGNRCIEVADVDGVKVCGILFDAGNQRSDTLLLVGPEKTKVSHKNNPIVLSDVYFRVGGGKYAGKVSNCVTINANNVIGDNFWVWRADHSENVGWYINYAPNGIIINGDDAIMYGLFVEHFQQYQTIWNGNNGKLFFYQSECPYDVPNQKVYKSNNGKINGYASFKVADSVEKFDGYGMGIYCYNRDANIKIDRGVETPDKKNVRFHNVVTVKLTGMGEISHVINKSGYPVYGGGHTNRILEYAAGEK